MEERNGRHKATTKERHSSTHPPNPPTWGSPYTSLVEVKSIRACTRFASPSIFNVPIVEVLIVLIGLYW